MFTLKKCFVIYFALIFFIIGCQKTPAEEAVRSREDFLADLKEVSSYSYDAPARFSELDKQNRLSITFNADIVVPEAKCYSITEVKQISYTEEQYRDMMNFFCPDAEWIEEPPKIKEELIEQYYRIQMSDRFTQKEKNEYAYLLEMAETAPETAEKKPFDVKKAVEEGSGSAWSLHPDGTYVSFFLRPRTGAWQYTKNAAVSVLQKDFLQPEYTESDVFLIDDFEKEPSVSKKEAIETAVEALKRMGLADEFALHDMEKAVAYDGRDPVSWGWQMVFTRAHGGLQVFFDFDGWTTWQNSPPPAYSAPWDREMIAIFVDDSGLYKIDVRGLGEETKMLYENVELLPFDKLIERIKQQLVYQHAFHENNITEQAVCIETIKLGLSVINIKNKPGYGMLIPSWTVYYLFTYNESGVEYSFRCSTVFNAVDGSYIEPRATADNLMFTWDSTLLSQ